MNVFEYKNPYYKHLQEYITLKRIILATSLQFKKLIIKKFISLVEILMIDRRKQKSIAKEYGIFEM